MKFLVWSIFETLISSQYSAFSGRHGSAVGVLETGNTSSSSSSSSSVDSPRGLRGLESALESLKDEMALPQTLDKSILLRLSLNSLLLTISEILPVTLLTFTWVIFRLMASWWHNLSLRSNLQSLFCWRRDITHRVMLIIMIMARIRVKPAMNPVNASICTQPKNQKKSRQQSINFVNFNLIYKQPIFSGEKH